MKPPETQVRKGLVGEWLHKAETDLQAAAVLLSCDPPLPYPSCFSSQQAAEKYLKAFLVHNRVDFPKTHDIQEILDLVGPINSRLAHSLEDAITLTSMPLRRATQATCRNRTLNRPKQPLPLPKRSATPSWAPCPKSL